MIELIINLIKFLILEVLTPYGDIQRFRQAWNSGDALAISESAGYLALWLLPGLFKLGSWSKARKTNNLTKYRDPKLGEYGRNTPKWKRSKHYRSGQVRVERLVHETARILGIRDLYAIIDKILYIPTYHAPAFVPKRGTRYLIMNNPALRGNLALLEAAHELGHALLLHRGRGGSMRYGLEEILVEGFARRSLMRAGKLSDRARKNSIAYENYWRMVEGLDIVY